MTDWGSAYGSSSGGSSGGSWGSVYGSSGTAAPSGGHSIFDSIPGASLVKSGLTAAENLGANVGLGVYNIGHAVVRDVINHPAALGLPPGPWTPFLGSGISLAEGGGGGHLASDVVDPMAKAYAAKYGPVFEHPLTGKSYRGIEKDPLGTALDVASLASIPFTAGGSAALRGGALAERLGMVGDLSNLRDIAALPKAERAAALAEQGTGAAGRVYTKAFASRLPLQREAMLGGEQARVSVPYQVEPARTPYGKLLQKGYLKVAESPAFVDKPIIGAQRMVAKDIRQSMALKDIPRQQQLAKFEKSVPLGSAKQAALHIAAQAPRDVAQSEWRQMFQDFYAKRAATPGLAEGDKLDAQHMLKIIGADNPKRAAAIDKVLTNPSADYLKFYEKGRGVSNATSEAIGSTPETITDRALRPAQALRDQLDMGKYAPAEAGAANPFGDPYIFSHRAPGLPRSNAVTLTRSTMPMGQIKTPTVAKFNQMVRFNAGRYMTNPSALTQAGLEGFRWQAAKDFQGVLDSHAVDIPETGVPKGWRRFEPTSAKSDLAVRERSALMEHGLTTSAHKDLLSEHWSQVLPKASTTATKMVPETIAKSVEQEFAKSNVFLKNFYDKPMDVWRFLVLRARPAWLIRNTISQHFLYALGNMGPSGFARYIQALRLERGDGAADNFLGKAFKVPAIRRKYLNVFEENGLPAVGHASTSAMYGGNAVAGERGLMTRGAAAVAPNTVGKFEQAAELRPLPLVAASEARTAVKSLGNLLGTLNQKLADDQPRIAQYLRLMHGSPAAARAQANMLRISRDTGDSISIARRIIGPSSEAIAKEITPEEHLALLRQTNKVLGDWATLSSGERSVVRRMVPFAQFFKTITQITKDLAVDHPEKVLFLHNLEVAANSNPSIFPSGKMPSWLKGAIAVSGVSPTGEQSLVETNIANHFAAPAQAVNAALGPLGVGQGSDTLGLLGPAYDIGAYALGKDPSTGNAYKGTGSSISSPILRALVAELGNLPQVSLGQQYLAGDRIPGTNTKIGAQYPSKLYDNKMNNFRIGGLPVSDAMLAYWGFPLKHVRLSVAAQDAAEGK